MPAFATQPAATEPLVHADGLHIEERVRRALEQLMRLGIAALDGEPVTAQDLADAAALAGALLEERHAVRLRALGDGCFAAEGRQLMLQRRQERAELARLTQLLSAPDDEQVGRVVLLACLQLTAALHAQ